MDSTNIKCRKTIHGNSPVNIANNISYHDSEEEFPDDGDSKHQNLTQDSDESLTKKPYETEKLKRRNQSNSKNFSTKSLNDSRKDLQRNSSFRHEQSNTMNLESGDVDQPRSSGITLFFLFAITIVVLIIAAYISKSSETPEKKLKQVCNFTGLRDKYHQEGEYLWKHLQYGHEDILNSISDKPAVFLFVHHGKEKAIKLINDIAETSSRCFGSSVNIKNIDFISKEAIKDYGHVIATYKKSVKEGNVILIANINKIPAEAAKALHVICDTVTPLVKKVIILLSLTVERKNNEEKVVDAAENALRQLWQEKIKSNELEPIITRVTDQVLLLQSN